MFVNASSEVHNIIHRPDTLYHVRIFHLGYAMKYMYTCQPLSPVHIYIYTGQLTVK